MSDEPRTERLPAVGWFVLTLVVYMALGLLFKRAVLNWVVGPLWLFGTLYLLPVLVRALRTRMGSR